MNQTSALLPSTRHHIGVIDPGPEFASVLRRLDESEESRDLVVGISGPIAPELAAVARRRGITVYDRVDDLLREHPETNLLALCPGDPQRMIALQQQTRLPVIGSTQLLSLIGTRGHEEAAWGCKVSLDEKEAILQTLVREIDEDILLLDPAKRIIEVSSRVAHNLGKTREDLIGTFCWEAWTEHGTPCTQGVDCPMDRTMATGKPAQDVITRIDTYGRVLYFNVNTYPILQEDGRPQRVLEVRRDITQRTYLELRLQQSEKMAAIGELSTYIAHEIRNPLFSLGGFANALLRSPHLHQQDREKVSIILEESKRLDAILKSILNFAKPMQAKSDVVDLNQVVVETMDVLGLGFSKEGISLDLRLKENLPRIKADAELIKQCLINLVKNGWESMTQGGRLTLRTFMAKKDVLLEVTDTGKGIPAKILGQVFNPFFSTKHKGSGLGLAMTKKIMEDLGGAVTLNSIENQGTTVTLFFPPLLAVEGEAEDPPSSERTP
jgi:two-component system, sporulation sensor kinase E